MEHREKYRQALGLGIDQLATIIRWHLRKINHSFHARLKSEAGIAKKLAFYDIQDVMKLRDVYGYRVLCDRNLIPEVARRLSEAFTLVEAKNYIDNPKPIPDTEDVHRCLQLTFRYNHCLFEVQVSTHTWHEINEKHHWSYLQNKYGED